MASCGVADDACYRADEKKFKKNEKFSLFLSGTPLLRAITIPGGDDRRPGLEH
jgi:hypothetical protein